MVNFDSLRLATLGALSYLSRETGGGGGGQTVEVVGCWPFTSDGNDIVGNVNYTLNGFYDVNLTSYARFVSGSSKTVAFPSEWSFEVLGWMNGEAQGGDFMQVASCRFQRASRANNYTFNIIGSNTSLISPANWTAQTYHYGLVKTGGKYKLYLNGEYQGQVNVPSTEASILSFTHENMGFINSRLCVGDITQNGVFPIRHDWDDPFTIENCHIIGGGVVHPRPFRSVPRPRLYAPVAALGGRA